MGSRMLMMAMQMRFLLGGRQEMLLPETVGTVSRPEGAPLACHLHDHLQWGVLLSVRGAVQAGGNDKKIAFLICRHINTTLLLILLPNAKN